MDFNYRNLKGVFNTLRRLLPLLYLALVFSLVACNIIDTDDYYSEGDNDSSHLTYLTEDEDPIKKFRAMGLFERHSLVPISDVLDLDAPLYSEFVTKDSTGRVQLLIAWQFKDQIFLALLDHTQVRFISDYNGETPEARFQFIMRKEFGLVTTDTGLYRLLANSDEFIRHVAIYGSVAQLKDPRYIRVVP